MNNLESLAPSGWTPAREGFQPIAAYFSAMDFVLYLREDCAFREDRIDATLTILLHPQEDRAVGVRLKGFRALYESVCERFPVLRKHLPFAKLVEALEIGMRNGNGDDLVNDASARRRRKAYERAKELLRDAELPAEEVERVEKMAA